MEAGAQEMGNKAQPGMLRPCCLSVQCVSGIQKFSGNQNDCNAGNQELVRSCLTPIPRRHSGTLHVKVLSEEDVWAQGVL